MNLLITIEATERIQRVFISPNQEGFKYQIQGNPTDQLSHSITEFFENYLQKKESPLPPFDWENVTPFTREVLEEMSKIPFGQTCTYGQLARSVGNPRASRAVGGACNRNPFPLFIPCHRVLAQNGIGGFALGLETKKLLLNHEEI